MVINSGIIDLYSGGGSTNLQREIYFDGKVTTKDSQFRSNKVSIDRSPFLTFARLSSQLRSPLIWYMLEFILGFFILPRPEYWAALIPLCLVLAVKISKESVQTLFEFLNSQAENDYEANLWNGQSFVTAKWKDLSPGHIIYINEGEAAPADFLLVTTCHGQSSVQFDKSKVTGNRSLQEVVPVKEMHISFAVADAEAIEETYSTIQRLCGKLQVAVPSPEMHVFRGRVQLQKSLSFVKVKTKNFVPRGFVLKDTKWVLGVVVYTGQDTKIWQSYGSQFSRQGWFSNLTNKFAEGVGCLIIFLSLCGLFLNWLMSTEGGDYVEDLVAFLVLFNVFMPISYLLLADVLKFVVSKKAMLGDLDCEVNRMDSLETLGCVDYVLTGKNNCLTAGSELVQHMVVGNTVYSNSARATFDGFDFKDLHHALLKGGDEQLAHFFKCILLCNDFLTQNAKPLDVLLEQAAQIGGQIEYKDDHMASILFGSEVIDFSIEAFHDSGRRRVLVHEQQSGQYVLYVMGEAQAMLRVLALNKRSKSRLKQLLQGALGGNQSLVLGYKILSDKPLKEFDNAFNMARLSPINKEARIEAVFAEHETGLNYAGLVGIEPRVAPETRSAIARLQRAGVKFWLLTGDSESAALSAAVGAGVAGDCAMLSVNDIETEHECLQKLEELVYNVVTHNLEESSSPDDASDDEDSELRDKRASSSDMSHTRRNTRGIITQALRHLRSTFGQLKTKKIEFSRPVNYGSKYNIQLAVEGNSLDFALQSVQTRRLLVVLLNIARSVVFYNLMPFQKKQVTRLIKNNFTRRCQVLGIGGTVEDVPLLQEADVSVSVNPSAQMRGLFTSDLSIAAFGRLEYMILCLGHWVSFNAARAAYFSVYSSFLAGTPGVLFFMMANFTAQPAYSFTLQFCLVHLLLIFPAASVATWDRDIRARDLLQKESIYSALKCDTESLTRRLTEAAMLGSAHGSVTLMFAVGYAWQAVQENGQPLDLTLLSSLIFCALYGTGLVYMFMHVFKKNVRTLSGFLISVTVFLILLLILPRTDSPYGDALLQTIEELPIILTIFLVVLANSVISLIHALVQGTGNSRNRRLNTNAFIASTIEKDVMKFFKDSKHWARAEEKYNFELKKYTLHFHSREREHNYYNTKIYKLRKDYSAYYAFLFVAFAAFFINDLAFDGRDEAKLAANLSSIVVLALYFLWSKATYFMNYYKELTLSYFAVLIAVLVVHSFVESISDIAPVLLVTVMLAFNVDWFHSCLYAFVLTTAILLIECLSLSSDHSTWVLLVEYISHFLGLFLICAIISYKLELSDRSEFIMQQKLELEAQKVHSVLSCLLPAFVRKRVKDGVRYIAEDQGVVTVIFCNICDFIEIIECFTPQELTSFLDETFRKFDHLCESVGVTKVETVGNTYMASVGLLDSDAEVPEEYRNISQSRRAIELGLLMLATVKDILLPTGQALRVKIGIHSGPVAAGVVGSHKPQFSLVGDTVNTASRMATTLEECNCIQFSQDTRHLLKEKEGLVFCDDYIQVKGKGYMMVYRMCLSDLTKSVATANLASPTLYTRNSLVKSNISLQVAEPSVPMRKSTVFALADVNNTRDFMSKTGLLKLAQALNLCSFRFVYKKEDETFRVKNITNMFSIFFAGIPVRIIILIIRSSTLGMFLTMTQLSLTLNLIELVCFVLIAIIMPKAHRSIVLAWTVQILVLLDTGENIVLYILDEFIELPVLFLICTYNQLLLTQCSLLLCSEATYSAIVATLTWIAVIPYLEDTHLACSTSFGLVFNLFIMAFLLHTRENKLRFNSNFQQTANNEIQETEKLLSKMFPPQIYHELKNDTIDINKFYNVTMLYADIVGFTQWSANKSPREVVDMLSELFTRFDHACEKHSVYKVHTIGDCYVVMGYNSGKGNRDPGQEALKMIDFAFSLLEEIKSVNQEYNLTLDMRIGMHTGDVIGGITGSNLVRYDVYGLDVLIANKVESNGLPGEIAVSNCTKVLIEMFRKYRFNFTQISEFSMHNTDIEVFKISKVN